MANRENHYEAAFEQFLRTRQVPYVAVDEAKRSLLAVSHEPFEEPPSSRNGQGTFGPHPSPSVPAETVPQTSLKSLDFIVSSSQGRRWLVDVKGRRFPSGTQKQYWKNWSTRDDLVSLAHWERLFGDRFEGLFVFAYHVAGDRSPLPAEQLFEFRGSLYGFVGIQRVHYAGHARPLSARWDTYAMPVGRFRQLAAPLHDFL